MEILVARMKYYSYRIGIKVRGVQWLSDHSNERQRVLYLHLFMAKSDDRIPVTVFTEFQFQGIN